MENLNANPDLYGPFWLMTTIIFLLSSTGNLSRYFFNWDKSDVYLFKLELVRLGVIVVYSFGFGVPTILYFVMKFLGCSRLTLPEVPNLLKKGHLHLWLLLELFHSYLPSVYYSSSCFTMDIDRLWDDKYHSVLSFQFKILP